MQNLIKVLHFHFHDYLLNDPATLSGRIGDNEREPTADQAAQSGLIATSSTIASD